MTLRLKKVCSAFFNASATATLSCAAVAMVLQACSPAPRHTLTSEEKKADLYWLFSQFGENYAPLDLKQKLYGFKYDDLKAQYLKDADNTTTNEEFYQLLYRFVAEFKDAHTSGSMTDSSLPGRAQVAYLGFSGKRTADKLVVTKLVPTLQKDDAYPIKIGDKISKLDGVLLADIVKGEMVKYRDLGSPEANLTYHFNKIFNRVTTAQALPKKDMAELTVVGGDGKEKTIKLPWITKDLIDFTAEQKAAADKLAATPAPSPSPSPTTLTQDQAIFGLGFTALASGNVDVMPQIIRKITRGTKDFNSMDTFVFVDTAPSWDSPMVSDAARELARRMGVSADIILAAAKTPTEEFKAERNIPDNVIWITDAKATFPTYIHREKQLDKDGKETGKTMVAYMYLNTFSPSAAAKDVLAEVTGTLKALQDNGVQNLVVDLLNNGGGSLVLGMDLAQLLSKDKITQPGMLFRLSDTWMDEFDEKARSTSTSDVTREYAKRILDEMKKDQPTQRLSTNWSAEMLMDYPYQKDTPLTDSLNIVLMTNEMCASMCDIFTAILKDNGMAKTVGAKTMGAGGNVVQHPQAPNSHFIVNQTESLIVRSSGSFIENNGVDPDVAMDTTASVSSKYDDVRLKAIKMLVAPDAPDSTPSPSPSPSASASPAPSGSPSPSPSGSPSPAPSASPSPSPSAS